MSAVTTVVLGVLAVAAVLVVVRLVRGPTVLDRAAAVDVFVAIVLCGVAVLVARRGSTVFVPVLLVLSLLGFAGSVAVVRFVGRDEDRAPLEPVPGQEGAARDDTDHTDHAGDGPGAS